jgi:FkbM family methyltransferase
MNNGIAPIEASGTSPKLWESGVVQQGLAVVSVGAVLACFADGPASIRAQALLFLHRSAAMSAIERIKDCVKSATQVLGYDIVRHRNVFRDIGAGPRTVIFDVGANEGQTIALARKAIEEPIIHAFEPTKTAYTILAKAFPNVILNNFALGPKAGVQEIKEAGATTMSSLLEPAKGGWDGQGWKDIKARYTVPVRTIDDYSLEAGIDKIELLKTDTQGYDLEVMKGAKRMFSEHRIRWVFTEITFPAMYQGQPSFEDIYSFLKERGLKLAGVYNVRQGDMNALFELVDVPGS